MIYVFCFFFFQAEDGIRDDLVTGVQTCALPISEFDIEYMYQVIKNKSIINAYNYLLSNKSTFMINNGPYLFKVKLGISTDIEDYKFGFGYEYLLHKKSYWHNISLNCGLSL